MNSHVSDQQWRQFEQAYQKWEKSTEVKSSPTDVQALSRFIEQAVEHIKKDRKKPQTSQLWQAQRQSLEAVLHYQNLVES